MRRLCFFMIVGCFTLYTSLAAASVQQAEQAIAKKEYIQARKLLERPASSGDAAAQDMLGHMFLFGRGGSIDADRAVALLQKAAEKGRTEAQNSLGIISMTGLAGTIDPVKGIGWFRKAAAGGHSYAMFNLGRAAEQGLGMQKSMDAATSWYQQAATRGNEEAKARLAELENNKRMAQHESRRQIADAAKSRSPKARTPETTMHASEGKTLRSPTVYASSQLNNQRGSLQGEPYPSKPMRVAGHPSGLSVFAAKLVQTHTHTTVSFGMLNDVLEQRSGRIAFYGQRADGSREALTVRGPTSFSLRNQAEKSYQFDKGDVSAFSELVLEIQAEGYPPLEKRFTVTRE